MNNFIESDRFWTILRRNRGKTLLMEYPDLWARITITKHGNVLSKVARTLRDLQISRSSFIESKSSNSLKSEFAEITGNYKINRAIVLKNHHLNKEDD